MEEHQDIDRKFKEQLEGFEMEPSPKVWTSIESRLNGKKKPKGLWFFLFALVAGLIGWGTWEYVASTSTKDLLTTNGTQTVNPYGSSAGSITQAEHTAIKSSAPAPSQESVTPTEVSSGQSSVTEMAANSPVNNQKPFASNDGSSGRSAQQIQSPASRSSSNQTNHDVKPVAHNNLAAPASAGRSEVMAIVEANQASPRTMHAEEQSGESSPEEKPVKESATSKQSKTDQLLQPPDAATSGNTTSPLANGNSANTASTTPSEVAPAETVTAEQTAAPSTPPSVQNAEAPPEAKPGVSPETPAPSTGGFLKLMKTIRNHSSLGLFYSPDYAVNRTTGTSNAEKSSTGYSWSAGVKYGYDLSNKWSVWAGANYSSYSKDESFSSVYVTSDSAYKEYHSDDHDHGGGWGGGGSHGGGHGGGGHGGGGHGGGGHDGDGGGPGHDGCHYVVHTSCGDIDLSELPPNSTGNEESGDTLSINSEVASSVEFLNVPLKLRFNIRSRKLVYYVEAGASLSFIVNSTAKIRIGDYSENNSVSGLTNITYSALLNAGVSWRFFRGVSFFFEPNLRYSFTPINDSGSEKSFPYFIGGNAGFSIHF